MQHVHAGAAHGDVRVEGEFTIYTAAEHGGRMRAALLHAGSVRIDLAGVTEFDTAGLQVLVAAHKQAADSGACVHFVAPSAAVSSLACLYGLDGWLNAAGEQPTSSSVVAPAAARQTRS